MILRPCATCGQLIEWVSCPTGGWWAHLAVTPDAHHVTPSRCSLHGTELLHERGGPSMPTLYGRNYCTDCQRAFMDALDRLAA